jgi:hypothetical protein
MVNQSDLNQNLEALMDPTSFGALCDRYYVKNIQLHRVVNGTDTIVLIEDKLIWKDCFSSGAMSTGWYQSCTDGFYYARIVVKVDFTNYTTGLIGLNSFQWYGDAGEGC